MNMNQEIKKDAGKLPLTEVPSEIIYNVASVRLFGMSKYGKEQTWRKVEVERYRDAMYRHWLAYVEDPYGLDEESGLPHLWHVAWNCATLCELEKGKFKNNKVDLSQIKSIKLNEEEFKKVKDTCENMLKDGQGLVIKADTPLQYVDNDGFDWSKGDYKEN